MKVKPFFRWFDLWIGVYIDGRNRTVYFCPIPMFGIKIDYRRERRKISICEQEGCHYWDKETEACFSHELCIKDK